MSAFTTARLMTWHVASRTSRVLKSRRIPLSGDPNALVKIALQMRPAFQPTNAALTFGVGDPTFAVYFGVDREGTQWRVEFDIPAAAFLAFFSRVMAGPGALALGMARMDVAHGAGDGGEEIPLPKASSAALAHMAAVSAAIN